jgi:hypothetical protein
VTSNQLNSTPPYHLWVPHLGYAGKTPSARHGANVSATRGSAMPEFGVPGNGSKKEGLAPTTSPEILKVPNLSERNLVYEYTII